MSMCYERLPRRQLNRTKLHELRICHQIWCTRWPSGIPMWLWFGVQEVNVTVLETGGRGLRCLSVCLVAQFVIATQEL